MIKKQVNDIAFILPAALLEICGDIQAVENNPLIYQPKKFEARLEALDFIDFHILGHIEALLPRASAKNELVLLRNRAQQVIQNLEAIDSALFQKLRGDLQRGWYKGKAFKGLVEEYVLPGGTDTPPEEVGYDNLDAFINGMLSCGPLPQPTQHLQPGMVFYQKTPARIIFQLVEQAPFDADDVFFDIGSGIGQVPVLINLLTGVNAKGIEFEPAFNNYANACAGGLNLTGVEFITTDARVADYSAGTIFFLYTPFTGQMLQEVLEKLRTASIKKQIKIVTYGPCTHHVAAQNWLIPLTQPHNSIYKLAIFHSV